MSDLGELPDAAAWRHRDARTGFEVVFFRALPVGHRLEGATAAVEDGHPWAVSYRIDTDADGVTRTARVVLTSREGSSEVLLDHDGQGRWLRDGRPAPELGGCRDVDLESSAMTNALPVRRLRLPIDARADAPAAYVRTRDLAVERLEQTYTRLADDGHHQRFHYTAARFDFTCTLVYDQSGLVSDYPGLAVQVTDLRHG